MVCKGVRQAQCYDFMRPDRQWRTLAEFEAEGSNLLSRKALSDFDQYVQLLPVKP